MENLDNIFNKMKWYDKFNLGTYALVFFAILITPICLGNVFYATRLLNYRCFIPECDSSYKNAEYSTEWLKNAVPFHEGDPEKCIRYVPIDAESNNACGPQKFYTNKTMRCDKFVFEEQHRTIAQDFGIYCNENNWKLTLPVAIGSVGTLFSFALLGTISDRYGRRTVIIFALESGAILGTLKSFSTSYIMFIILEFIEQIVSTGCYVMIITYATEQTKIKNRSRLVSITGVFYSVGEIFGIVMSWVVYDWRNFIRIVFLPAFLSVLFYYISPESVRWLISKKRYTEAENNLKMNFGWRRQPENNDECQEMLLPDFKDYPETIENKRKTNSDELRKFFSNRILIGRLLICALCMFSVYTLYYGLTYYMITFHGNFYIHLILLSLVEIPANLFSASFLDCWNRRHLMIVLQAVPGLCCVCSIIFTSSTILSFVFIVVAKFLISVAFTLTEIYIHEAFPTTIRGTLASACIALGYIGNQIVIQVPILATYWSYLPLIIFASISLSCCILIPFLPETLGKSLPKNVDAITKTNYQNEELFS